MTQQQTEATARPWKVKGGNIIGADGLPVASRRDTTEACYRRPVDEQRSNAAMIVASVNAHDDLMSIARAAESMQQLYCDPARRFDASELRAGIELLATDARAILARVQQQG